MEDGWGNWVELQGALEHRIAQMTPEQRRERLRELTERALTIDHDPEPKCLGIAAGPKLDADQDHARFPALGFKPGGLAVAVIKPSAHVPQHASEDCRADQNFHDHGHHRRGADRRRVWCLKH